MAPIGDEVVEGLSGALGAQLTNLQASTGAVNPDVGLIEIQLADLFCTAEELKTHAQVESLPVELDLAQIRGLVKIHLLEAKCWIGQIKSENGRRIYSALLRREAQAIWCALEAIRLFLLLLVETVDRKSKTKSEISIVIHDDFAWFDLLENL